MTGKDGVGHPITLRDELSGIPRERWGPEVKRLLEGPEMPTAVGYVWEWFCELSNARRAGMGGAEPIGADQIIGWQQLRGVRLHAWEIACIEALDVKWRSITNEYQERRSAG